MLIKHYIVAATAIVGSMGTAHAQDAALDFPRQSIELPALSLSGAAQQVLKSRLPDMTPRALRTHQKKLSTMPVGKPHEEIGDKVLIARPDVMKGFRLEVASPKVESQAK